MRRGAVGLLLAALLPALLACTGGGPAARDDPRTEPGAQRCRGVAYGEVRGSAPRLPAGKGSKELATYRADGSVCEAWWVPQVGDLFVPQALEVSGRRVFVGGYRWDPAYSPRPCQIAVLDRRTGEVEAFVERFEAPVYRPEPTYCRHGGGLEATRHGLWVVETERLWLLDPDRLGRGDPVRRVWRLAPGIKGSTLAVGDGRVGIGSFRSGRGSTVIWFRLTDVLADGVDDLVLRGGDGDDARATHRGRVVDRLQGLTLGPGGVWQSRSSTGCGELVTPAGERVAFVPGAEDVELEGDDLWTVSEAGTRPYLGRGEAVVPQVLRLDRRSVLARPSTCDD